ncbi:hypothetical protein RFI_32009, partial [Reticulomyxa filosa]
PVYCCFQKFGCDTPLFEQTQSEHCTLHMQAHLLLVDNHIHSLQQKMLEKDDHIQHLQTQLQMQQTELAKLLVENAVQMEEIFDYRNERERGDGGLRERGGRGRDRDVNRGRGRDNLAGKNWIERDQQQRPPRTGLMRQEGRHFKHEDFRTRERQYRQLASAAVAEATLLVDDNVRYDPFSSQKEKQRHDVTILHFFLKKKWRQNLVQIDNSETRETFARVQTLHF